MGVDREIWDDIVEIAVVGGGGAGLMAALAAAEKGATVSLFEREAALGGKTALAMGILTASQTEAQRSAGIEDSHADHLAELRAYFDATGARLEEEKARFLIERSPETFERLTALGVRIEGPHPERPHRTPRLHNVIPDGGAIVEALAEACREAGARIVENAPAKDLILDYRGRTTGLVCAPDGHSRRIRAERIILAAGDSAADFPLIEALTGSPVEGEIFRAFASGEVQRMAMRAGARMNPPQRHPAPQYRFVQPPHVEPTADFYAAGAVRIDSSGRKHPLAPGAAVKPEDVFVVFDSTVAARLACAGDDIGPGRDGWKRTGKPYIATAPSVGYFYLADCRELAWYAEADTVDGVAALVGCDRAAIAASGAALTEPPFYVLGPLRRYIMIDGAGLAIDDGMRVLSVDGDPIPGLYAAGACAGWIHYFGGHGHALGWALASGRVAGARAADDMRRNGV